MKRLLLVLTACSGGKPKVVSSDDAKASAHPTNVVRAADASGVLAPGKGDVSIRVEWKDVPLAARTPKPCGPDVAPTTTWGIPDTVVTLASSAVALPRAGSAAGVPPQAGRVTVDRCITPRVQIASETLVIASGKLEPTSLTFDKLAVLLPIAGHEVSAPVSPGRHELVAGDAHAWVVRESIAAVTDASGVAILRDLPSGVYPITAWQPATNRSAAGEVTVQAGALAEVTLQLQPTP